MKARMPAGAVRFETRGVLAGAYMGRGKRGSWTNLEGRALLTHMVFLDAAMRDVRAGCRIPVEHLVDSCGMGEAEGAVELDARPTCAVCGKRWDRLVAMLAPAKDAAEEGAEG